MVNIHKYSQVLVVCPLLWGHFLFFLFLFFYKTTLCRLSSSLLAELQKCLWGSAPCRVLPCKDCCSRNITLQLGGTGLQGWILPSCFLLLGFKLGSSWNGLRERWERQSQNHTLQFVGGGCSVPTPLGLPLLLLTFLWDLLPGQKRKETGFQDIRISFPKSNMCLDLRHWHSNWVWV